MPQDQKLTVVKSEPLPPLTVTRSEPSPRGDLIDYDAIQRQREARALATIRGIPIPTPFGTFDISALGLTPEDVTGALPTAGGAVGGALGGVGGTAFGVGFGGIPGAVAGATVGGAAGESFRQLLNRVLGIEAPATSEDAAQAIGQEGLIQGGAELGGLGLAAGVRAGGRGLVHAAVRPTAKLGHEFPGVMDTIIRERLPVGAGLFGGLQGSQVAAERLGDAGKYVRALLAKAEAAGRVFSPDEIAKPVQELFDEILKEPVNETKQRQLAGLLAEFLNTHPGPLTPTAVKDLKQVAQKLSVPVLRAERMGVVTPEQSTAARFNRAIGTGSKDVLETIPGVAEGEQRAQSLIGAQQALAHAEARHLSRAAEIAGPAAATLMGLIHPRGDMPENVKQAATTWLVLRGFLSPRTLSRTGLALTEPMLQELVRQIPRLGAWLARAGVDVDPPIVIRGGGR